MLELKDIVKDYASKENVVHVLKGVNLKFRDNEFVAILGPSGCGKTTLLNSQYELVGSNSRWPQNYDEVVIVLDEENSLNDYTLFALGLKDPSELLDAIVNGNEFVSQEYSADDLL